VLGVVCDVRVGGVCVSVVYVLCVRVCVNVVRVRVCVCVCVGLR